MCGFDLFFAREKNGAQQKVLTRNQLLPTTPASCWLFQMSSLFLLSLPSHHCGSPSRTQVVGQLEVIYLNRSR